MNKQPETHVVKEIVPGVFWTLLDFPSINIFQQLIDKSYTHVLCWGHHVGKSKWQEFMIPIVDPKKPESVLARAIEIDFVVPTDRFIRMLPTIGSGIKAVQLSNLPQNHLDLRTMHGKELWILLNEIGWYVWAEILGNDYAQIASPIRSVVEQAIKLSRISKSGDTRLI